MIKHARSFVLVILLAGCTVFGPTPEARIEGAIKTHTSAVQLTTNLLQRDVITVAQAKDSRAILGTARGALDGAVSRLKACRAKSPPANPDPCESNVGADITMASSVMLQVENFLRSKEVK